MAASSAWLSVQVKRGFHILHRPKILGCTWETSFGEMLAAAHPTLSAQTIAKIVIDRTDRFRDPQEVSIDAPVYICHQFGCKFVCYELEGERSIAGNAGSSKNAFDVLMCRAREAALPPKSSPPEGRSLRGDQRLRNDVLDSLGRMQVGWAPDVVATTGESFVRGLTDALWTLDPHHKSFQDRSILLPTAFSIFQGYNDWQKKKQKKPQLTQSTLDHHIGQLSEFLMQPWFCKPRFQALRSHVDDLVNSMSKYKAYLEQHNTKMARVHSSPEPVRSADTSFVLQTISKADHPTDSCYVDVEKALDSLDFYDPVFLNDYAPLDRYQRRHWLDKISCQFPIMVYRFAHGSSVGTMCFAWKINTDTVDQTAVSQTVSKLNSSQNVYAMRAMRKEFLEKYNHLCTTSKAVLRSMYKSLVGDSSASSCATEKEVDDRVAQSVLGLDDPEIILDLRQLNGNPRSTNFDTFWEEVSSFLEESSLAVDERRHTDVLHMPVAVSVRHLRDCISERLQQKYPERSISIPSSEWIRLQFWPSNPYAHSAVKYTGRFQVKYAVQVRQLRKDHPDSKYVNVLLKYAKEFTVQNKAYVQMISIDDKATIPV